MATRTPDDVVWETDAWPGKVVGNCAHECQHAHVKVVAVGPDDRRKHLIECTEPACGANPAMRCRSWQTVRLNRWGPWRAVWIGVKR